MSSSTVLGHTQEMQYLSDRMREDKLSHALIFAGPEGIGKKRTALQLAKNMICRKGSSAESCGSCPDCTRIDQRVHPDVLVVEPNEKKHIVINDIRQVLSWVSLKPFEAEVKIAILDQAQAMNLDAQNALLKILEEPPSGVYFVLVASDFGKLLATIQSRCQKLSFHYLSDRDITCVLVEELSMDAALAERLARLLRGSFRRLGQLKAFDFITAQNEIFELLGHAKEARVVPWPDWSKKNRDEIAFIFEMLTEIFRDVLLLLSGNTNADRVFYPNRATDIQKLSKVYSADEVNGLLNLLGEASEDYNRSVNPKLLMMNLWAHMGLRLAR